MLEDEIIIIQLKKSVAEVLREMKKYPSETYSEIILELVKNSRETYILNTVIEKIQESKMKELWGEGDYSGWENA